MTAIAELAKRAIAEDDAALEELLKRDSALAVLRSLADVLGDLTVKLDEKEHGFSLDRDPVSPHTRMAWAFYHARLAELAGEPDPDWFQDIQNRLLQENA